MVVASSQCRYASVEELHLTHPPSAAERWLGTNEKRRWESFRSTKHRLAWLAGRVLAKRVLLGPLRRQHNRSTCGPREIEILSEWSHGRPARPHIVVGGQQLSWSISISHTQRGALVAVAYDTDVSVGVDLTPVTDFGWGAGFRKWFTTAEQRWLEQRAGNRRIATAWAIKEAVYKACNRGEGFAPRQIEVNPLPDGTWSCRYGGLARSPIRTLQCWQMDGQAAVLVTVPSTMAPSKVARAPGPCEGLYDEPHECLTCLACDVNITVGSTANTVILKEFLSPQRSSQWNRACWV